MLKSRNKITTIFSLNTSFDFNADDYLHAFQVQQRLSNNILCHSISRNSFKEQLKYFLKNYTCLVNLFPPDNLLIKWFIFLYKLCLSKKNLCLFDERPWKWIISGEISLKPFFHERIKYFGKRKKECSERNISQCILALKKWIFQPCFHYMS